MKIAKIMKLEAENFMGVKSFNYDFNGKNMIIEGDNHTGKTSIKNMVTWCLTGKDGFGNDESNFGLRPYDVSGELIHNINITVKLTLDIDGTSLVLERSKVERLSKTRGSSTECKWVEETQCKVNDVPKKVTEFESIIKDSLTSLDQIALLTNPDAFNDLKWRDQRAILVKLADDISDEEVIKRNNELLPLLEKIKEGKTIDDVIAIVKSEIPSLQKRMDQIPYAISELNNIDFGACENLTEEDIETLKQEQTKLNINLAVGSTKTNPNENKINLLTTRLQELEDERKKKYLKDKEIYFQNLSRNQQIKLTHENAIKKLEYDVAEISKEVNKNLEELEELKNKKTKLLEEYKEISSRTFNGEICPYCNQPLPKDKLEEALEKFNNAKAEELKVNIQKGKELKAKIEELKVLDNELSVKHDKTLDDLEKLKNGKITFEETVEPILAEASDLEKGIAEEIKNLQTSNVEENTKSMQERIEEITKIVNSFELKKQTQERIAELTNEQKEVGYKLDNAKRLRELCSLFISKKCELIETKINLAFENVKFKLFDTLKNGGIVETCEATLHGVPFRNLSNSERINAGIDIINTLQAIFDCNLPLIIDNAECINSFVNTDSQTIKLYVKETGTKVLSFYEED